MGNLILRKLLIVSIFLGLMVNVSGQVVTENDGFEGTPSQGIPPNGWHNCGDGNSSCDTQPGPFFNHMQPSQGSSYISLVTREFGPPGSVETVWSYLNYPFRKGHTYTLLLDITQSESFEGWYDLGTYIFDNPVRLEIIGITGSCYGPGYRELLNQSEIIHHFSWRTFEFTITPQTDDFEKIGLRAQFISPGEYKNSALLIDNLRYKEKEPICYPNPTNGELTIDYTSTLDDDCVISIFDYTGKLIKQANYGLYAGNNYIKTSLENLATGPYLLEFKALKSGKSFSFNVINVRN